MPGRWVFLAYRLPREPSTPRIAVWRKLKQLGVAQLLDGLVALPCDARTREALEWVAAEVAEAGGEASVWIAEPASRAQERKLAEGMAERVAVEYRAVTEAAAASAAAPPAVRRRVLARLRRELRRIGRRDYFPRPERERARTAVDELANRMEPAA